MDFGQPVAQNIQAPDITKTLGGLMGLQQQKLGIQQAQQNLARGAAATQMAQQDAQQRAAVANVDWGKYADGTGMISPDKMIADPALRQAAGDSMLDVVKQGATIRQQQLQNSQSLAGLNDTLRGQFSSMVGALRTDPDVVADNPQGRQKVVDAMTNWAQQGGPEAARVASIYAPVAEHAPPGKLAGALGNIQLQAMSVPQQVAGQSPNYVNTGGSLQQTNPLAAGGNPNGAPSIPNTLPPTTGTIGSDGTQGVIGSPKADFSGLKGPGRSSALAEVASSNPDPDVRREAANVLANRPQGFVPQSLPAGQAQNISNNVDEMNRHFASLQDSSSGLQLASSLTGNIKALSHQAITGTDADKLSYVNGLLAHLPGFTGKPETDLKTATDLLEKNMAQLNLSTPASSDAARAMVSIARPHNSMTPDAADEASDQLVGQIKSNMAMRNALQGYKMRGDVQGYQGFRSELEQVADPRIWQLEGKSPQDQAAFMQKLAPEDRNSLVQKAQQLHQMGMIQ